MKGFQLEFFYLQNKSTLLRTILLLIMVLFYFFNLSAQKESNVKLKIETGVLWDWVGGRTYLSGSFLNVEPKLKVSKNTVIGLRLGAAVNSQRILSSDRSQFYINNDFENSDSRGNVVISLVPTFDYYFSQKKLRPYLGLGLGYNFLTTYKKGLVIGNPSDELELSVNNQLGLLLRGGVNLPKVMLGRLDLSKLIVGLEFNYIPKTDVEISSGQKVGTVVTSNIALSIGYTIGDGKS